MLLQFVAAGNPPRAPSLSVELDDSMIPACRKVLAADPPAVLELLGHPTVRMLSEGMRPEVTFTPNEFAEASRDATDDARFSWKQLRARRDQFERLHRWIESNEAALRSKAGREATRFIVALPPSSSITAHLTCGAPWDAFGPTVDGRPELFLDLGLLAQKDEARARSAFQAILTHELWHAALALQQSRLGWPDYRNAADPPTRLAFVMLNEGGGHFFSLGPRLGDHSSGAETEAKFRSAFALFAEKYPAYASETDEDQRWKMLRRSHAGVPFWEKWGAIPGASLLHRLSRVLGDDQVARLVSTGPYEFIFRYAELQARNPDWPALPPRFLTDLRRAVGARP